MLEYVGEVPRLPQPCCKGLDMFVCGCLPCLEEEEKYVCVDLEKDGQEFDENQINISIDIDSIIWTTRHFVCKTSIGVYMMPVYDGKPGIAKHNHIYVNILIPQSGFDQQAGGQRTEWLSKKFPMTAIPHAPIGKLGSASGHNLAVYIMFPRMIHRSPFNGRRINMIPQEVLERFWEEVFLPAIAENVKESWAPYVKQTLMEAKYKMSGSRASSKTTPLSNKAFEDVQRSMRRKIEQDNRLLSMYGSFFFVVEGKGIKLLTKDGQDGVHESPEIALQRNLSCLDWTYMLDREAGELVVDIGVTFTPESDKGIPMEQLASIGELSIISACYQDMVHYRRK